MQRPNIVMIVADDTTPNYHSGYGGPTPTPHIDRLMREGVRFDRGYCCASLCCPSRWTLFTGQYVGRSRWVHQGTPADEPYLVSQNGMLDPETPTLAKALREAGYLTGHVGKWHSRFDTGFLGGGEPTMASGDPDDPAVDAEIRRRQALAQEVVRQCAGFEHAACVSWGNISGNVHPKLRHHNIAWMTDGALEFLDQAAQGDRPFYLHLANSVPHTPDCNDSLGADHRYTFSGKLAAPPKSHPADETVLDRLRAAGLQTQGPIAGVNAGMVMLDDQVGAVLARLDELGLAESTIVIYTADHGIPGKGSCHIDGQHLPFVLRWPAAVPAGRVVSEVFSWTDVVPTLCEACGVSMPAGHTVDGVSVLGALRGESPWPRQVAFSEMGWSRSVVKGRWHYIATRYPGSAIEAFGNNGDAKVKVGIGQMFDKLNAPFKPGYFDADQLYDLATDPGERWNLAADPARAAVLADMQAELRRIIDTLPRPFPAEPDAFLDSARYQQLLAERRAELSAIEHYPPGDAAHIWFANLRDPCVSA